MGDRSAKQSTYLPTLDGWRALSIALVILHHSQLHLNIPVFGPLLQWLSNIGEVGVEIFFAISGLLICSRLLDEEARTTRINVKAFYLRRCSRILPAAVFYLLVIAILGAFHVIPLLPLDWFGALFFFRNYAMVAAYLQHSPLALHWYTGHFWSLSMEEHFYLVLPAALVCFRKSRLRVLGSMAIAITLWRSFWAHVMHNTYQLSFRTDTHVDALLIPAMIAVALYPLLRNQAARRFLPAWSFPVLLAVETGLVLSKVPLFFTLQAIVLPLLILSTVLHPKTIPGRILEFSALRWVGWISYSLYLWQQLFFGVNFAGSPPGLFVLRQPPISFLALLACATLSYYAVEKPFIRWGHQLASHPLVRGARSETGQSLPGVRYRSPQDVA
jgi:peptidoglycan/LPS O-acetylase OafA/YrhL